MPAVPDRLTLPAYPAAALLLAVGAPAIPGGSRHFLSALAGMATAWMPVMTILIPIMPGISIPL